MCISCAIGTETERKGSNLWTKMRRFGRFLADEALKKTQSGVMDLEIGSCLRTRNTPMTSSSSTKSSDEVPAALPLLLGASNPEKEKQIATDPKEINISRTKQEFSPRRNKDDIFLDVFDAKSSLESFLFRKTFSSKEFIGPKLLSSIPIQLVVELSKLHADADALPPRANPIEHDSKIPRIKRRSKVFCEKSLKRSHSSSKALKVESQSKPECFKKKHVMFADDCGKSLEHIRTIENLDEIGYNSFDDNYYGDYDSGEHENEREIIMTSLKGMRSFIPMYLPKYDLTQRQSKLDFQKVVLTELKTYGIMIVGVVAVVNLGFQKEVTLRYTTDDWKSFHDTSMTHLERGTGLPFYDQFCFEVHCRPAEIKNEVIFCIRFKCAFGEFWDNNSGKNYSLKLKK